MKTIIFLFFLSAQAFCSDKYVLPQEVITALKKTQESLQKLHIYIKDRYHYLYFKKNLSLAEAQELEALSIIIFGDHQDLDNYIKSHENSHKQKNIMP